MFFIVVEYFCAVKQQEMKIRKPFLGVYGDFSFSPFIWVRLQDLVFIIWLVEGLKEK
jgi:hypothetical protein